jgi:uncharacterized protein (DUF427 family)
MPDDRSAKPNLWSQRPDYRVDFVPCPKRVRAVLDGTTVVDTTDARLMLETGHTPVYYVPPDAIDPALLVPSDTATFCPFKGDARYWHLRVGDRRVADAVWAYPEPFPEKPEIKDWLAPRWHAMDHWYEEDEEVVVHPRDPHVRIDVRRSSRPVAVWLDGVQVAESRRARFLFETGLPTRFYLPAEDVRTDLLSPSDSRTGCPYKGFARYWHVTVDGRTHRDLVWSYPEPFDEVLGVRELLCFYEERVDGIDLDGTRRDRPRTKFAPA